MVNCHSTMGRISLPPGFRFHPTDVELVMYYLKRKVMGKKLHFEAITEINIYKFSPWELPGTFIFVGLSVAVVAIIFRFSLVNFYIYVAHMFSNTST